MRSQPIALICLLAGLALSLPADRANAQLEAFTINPVLSGYGHALSGTRRTDPFGGLKFDLILDADAAKLHLWQGGALRTHTEVRTGSNILLRGGAALPTNTALATPTSDGTSIAVTQLLIEQIIGSGGLVQAGKIDFVDLYAKEIIIGGAGRDGFEHIALAAPPNGMVPAATLGALGAYATGRHVYSLMVYDPTSSLTTSGLGHAFSNGVSFMGSVKFLTASDGLPGSHTLTGFASTRHSLDLRDISFLTLPAGTVPLRTRSPWVVSYAYQHLLVKRDKHDDGWGVYGQFGVSDGNPNPIAATLQAAIGGSGLFASRRQDRFGIGYFYYGMSDDLRNSLAPVTPIDAEQGGEVFYNVAWFPNIHVGANMEMVSPLTARDGIAFLIGIRTTVSF